MVKHVVIWTMKESALGKPKETNALEMKRVLEALNGKIPGMIRAEVGIDFSRSEASADVVLYSEFESRAALASYQDHPAHVAAKSFIGSVRRDRLVVDYEA